MGNVIFVNDGQEASRIKRGEIGPIVQGQEGLLIQITVMNLGSSRFITTGGTISAVMENKQTGEVYQVTGTMAPNGTAGIDWTLSAGDAGTPGTYDVIFTIMKGGIPYIAIPATFVVIALPGAGAVQNPTLVGIPAGSAAWLASSIASGVAGNVPVFSANGLVDSGYLPGTAENAIPKMVGATPGDLAIVASDGETIQDSGYKILFASMFADLSEAIDEIVALGGNVVLQLQQGQTYTMNTQKTITGIDNVIMIGNGCRIHGTMDSDAIFDLTDCQNWWIKQVIFTSTGDESSANDAFRLDSGCERFYWIGCDFSYFGNSSFRGLPDSDIDQIHFWFCIFHHMTDGTSASPYGQGIDLSSVIRATVIGCMFHHNSVDNKGHSIYTSRGGVAEGSKILIANCQVWDETGTAFMIVATGGGSIDSVVISGCIVSNSGQVRVGNCLTASIAGNTLIGSYFELASTDRATISANHLYGPGFGSVVDGVVLNAPPSQFVTIQGNTFEQYRNAVLVNTDCERVICNNNVSHNGGKFFTITAGTDVSYAEVKNNTFENFSGNGIDCNAGGLVVVVGNTQLPGSASPMADFDNVVTVIAHDNKGAAASFGALSNVGGGLIEQPLQISGTIQFGLSTFSSGDTTPSLLSSFYHRTNNSTPTTITGFDQAVRGQLYHVLINDPNTTLNFSTGNLLGNQGVDYVCNLNDMLQVMFDGSKCHVWISKAA